MKTDLKGLDAAGTEKWVLRERLEPYRARQIRHWMFKRLAGSFQEMHNLPKPLRESLDARISLRPLVKVETVLSEDGTEKSLFRLQDGHHIESVLIPERDHATLCVSTQAGCAMGCLFCLTGRSGLKRNLTAGEIVEQVIQVKRSMDTPEALTNVVFMGMGEPLANYDAVRTAVMNLVDEDGMNFSHRRVTLSTCGLVPQMAQMGRDMKINLAVSLNAADDSTRSRLMPVNRTYPLAQLIAACRAFPLPNRRMITFEYILVGGMNDRRVDAEKLAALLSGLPAKINLIPLNAHSGCDMAPPSMERVLRFQQILAGRHYTAIIRKSKGRDIQAACGQLSGSRSREG